MKRNLILCACITLLFSACSKDKDDNASANSWTFGGNSYTAAAVSYDDAGTVSTLSAPANGNTSTTSNSLIFYFTPPPTISSQITISDSGDPNTVMIAVTNYSNSVVTGYINDVTATKANVTINNGKASVTFQGNIWLHKTSDFNDSLQLSVGTITQQ